MLPFLVVGTAGSVDIGAIDHLTEIASVCAEQRLWFHVDAAFGAIAMLSAALRPLFAGIERANFVAFDFHKWAQVPYDAGCIVVRDPAGHEAAFSHQAAYLKCQMRGLAAGRPWPVDLGPELSRGFRALKVWMTIKAFGANRLGDVAERSCLLARRFAAAIDNEPLLERTAPVRLNIVCFRYRPGDDELQTAIAADLQEAGDVVLSTTTIGGRTVLRAAFVNHRSDEGDADAVIPAVPGRRSAASGCRGSRSGSSISHTRLTGQAAPKGLITKTPQVLRTSWRSRMHTAQRTAAFACTMAFSALLATAQAKTLVYCSEGSPENFNPMLNTTGTTFDANEPIYNRLVEFKPGSTEVSPALAERWEISEDGKIFTFHLRHDVKWQSNKNFKPTRDFNADDVLFSFERQWKEANPYHKVSGGGYDYFNDMSFHKLLASIEQGRSTIRCVHADRAAGTVPGRSRDGFLRRSSRRNMPMRC